MSFFFFFQSGVHLYSSTGVTTFGRTWEVTGIQYREPSITKDALAREPCIITVMSRKCAVKAIYKYYVCP